MSATVDDPAIQFAMSGGQAPIGQVQAQGDQPSTGDPAIDFAMAGGSKPPQRPQPKPMTDAQHLAFLQQSDRPLQGVGTAVVQTAGQLLQAPGKALTGFAVRQGVTNPYAAAAIGVIPDIVEDVGMGLAGRALGTTSDASAAAPYAAQEEAEISRIGDIHANAQAKGFVIPETATPNQLSKAASTNQPLADNVVRGNFNLSPKAPLTPQMMDSWRGGFNASNTYAEARAVPKVQLNDNAVESLASLPKPLYDRLGLDNKIAPDNTVAGSDAMDINQALRARASAFWKTSKMLPEYEDQAVAVTKAADSVEDSVSPYLKDPAQWALDRAKNAQSYNVQSALDGGHVDVGDLARMKFAKGQIKPWTGDISDLADLGNLHPDAFQLTRTPLPNYSALRKGLSWAAGTAATGAAAKLGWGAAGHFFGQQASNAVTPE